MPNSSISRSRRPCRSRMRSRTSPDLVGKESLRIHSACRRSRNAPRARSCLSSNSPPRFSNPIGTAPKNESRPKAAFSVPGPLRPIGLRRAIFAVLRFRRKSSLRAMRRLACQPKPQSGEGWWSQAESNRRPLECHSSALPTELWPHPGRGVGMPRQSVKQMRLVPSITDHRSLSAGSQVSSSSSMRRR